MALLVEIWVPNSLWDAEDSGKAQNPPAGELRDWEEHHLHHLPLAQSGWLLQPLPLASPGGS